MELLKQEITAFTSSNITESVSAWDSVTAYTVGQYALVGTYIYKCVSAHTNKPPEENTGIYWVKWSISNRGAMLDLSAQSKSYLDGGNLTVVFPQNRMSTLAIGNYEAASITVDVLALDGTTVLWTITTPSSLYDGVEDWYTWMYSPYNYEVDRATKIDIGVLDGTSIRVIFTKSTASTRTACGYLVGGAPYSMGSTLSQVGFKFNSFAVKNTDDFGTLTITKRAVQDIVDFETIVPHNTVPTIRRKIKEIYNDIIVFIVDESDTSEYENLLTLGTVESASVVLTEFDKTTLTWSVVEAI